MTDETPPTLDPFDWLPESAAGALAVVGSVIVALLVVGFTIGVPVGLLVARIRGHG